MSTLVMECRPNGHTDWLAMPVLRPGEQPGSISSNGPAGRDVILFRNEGGTSVIERSRAGFDFEAGGSGRVLATEGTEALARLQPGESYEMEVLSDAGRAYTARWTHKGDR